MAPPKLYAKNNLNDAKIAKTYSKFM